MATVRGMGVAVMTRTCACRSPLARSASRCSTPNRCCSSTTTSPRSANCTCSPRSACVPTTIPAAPLAASSSACLRAAAPSEPVSRATCVPCSAPPSRPPSASGPRSVRSDRACWAARTSVGARSAACPPASTTWSMARSATTVLPEPTSPWSRRCIGRSAARSRASCSPTARWPSVSSNGSAASKSASRLGVPVARSGRAVAGSRATAARRWASAVCRTKASSNRSRRRPRRQSSSAAGRCTSRSASSRVDRCRRSRSASGSGSGTSSSRSGPSTVWTALWICHEGTEAPAG